MAILPPVGAARRCGPTGEHGTMRIEQLLNARVLAIMAPVIQPLGGPVHLHPPRRRQECCS